MALILFSTTDVRSNRKSEFKRLLSTIGQTAAETPVKSYVLLQNCSAQTLEALRADAPSVCRLMALPGTVSVSTARTILFQEAFSAYEPTAYDVIGFPDDDCWLPSGFGARVAALFAERSDLDLFVCRCSLDPAVETFDAKDITAANIPRVVRLSSSNTMYVRGSTVAAVGGFDPDLGLGTQAGGGEDTDYAVRAYLASRFSGFIDRPLVGHPAADQQCAVKYFRGALIVLARHALRRPALLKEFLRKLLVGVFFVLKRRISPREYIGATGQASASFAGRDVSFPLVTPERRTLPA